MCGIAGEVLFEDGAIADGAAIQRMLEVLSPRGPDGAGALLRGRVALGHRRLRIIDLSPRAEQPLADPELGLAIVFNGCIYNYRELRAELQALGYRFFSAGDTEVILKAFHAWGGDCVRRFHGMFAFAIHERDSGRLTLARDRFGIKPLYLAETRGRLRFASTLPALVAAGDVDTSIDPVALQFYMSFHAVVPPPWTILKGIRKLPPATVRVVGADGVCHDRVYWEPHFGPAGQERDLEPAAWEERVHDALRVAVKRRMVADVPVGVLLSGGLDSSLIVGLLAEAGQHGLMSFSIGFDEAHGEKGDEFEYSDLVARHFATDHRRLHVSSVELLAELPSTIRSMSEPMVSYDNAGFFLLSRAVSRHIKVVQSGQGADEIFGGYHWYPPMSGSRDAASSYARAFFDRDHATLARQLAPGWHHGEDVAFEFVREHFGRPGADDPVDKALRIDAGVMLVDDPVKRVDNMSMAWGLEARVPFLDHELAELAARVPAPLKLAHGGKGILKDVARKVIPAAVIDRPKGYFPVPALKFIDGQFLVLVREALTSQAARARALFRLDYLERLFAKPRDHITPLRGSELWQAGLLELWLQAQGVG